MTIKYSVGLPAVMTKIVLTGLMMAVAGVIYPAAMPPQEIVYRDKNKALLKAVDAGDAETVDALLAARADANVVNQHGLPALIVAARYGRTAIVELLLAGGAHIDTVGGFDGATALIFAARDGHTQTVDALLAARANPDIVDHSGKMTALLYAYNNRHPATVQAMVAALQLDVTKFNISESDFNSLPDSEQKEILNILLKFSSNDTKWALFYASDNGLLWAIQPLIDQGLHIDTRVGHTALICSVAKGHNKIVELLLNKRANPNSTDPMDIPTVLLTAVEHDRIDIVRALLVAQADPNFTTPMGDTPLLKAADGSAEVVKELLAAKANQNITNAGGWTPLSWATCHNHEIIPILFNDHREQLVRESCMFIQQINDLQANIDSTTALSQLTGDGNRAALEQLPLECSHLIMQQLPISSLGCIRQVSKTCRIAAELLLLKALKEKIQREQKENFRKWINKAGCSSYAECEKIEKPYDFWQAAITQQLAMQEAGTARLLRGMFAQVDKK